MEVPPMLWDQLHGRLTLCARRYLGAKSVRGRSADDLASEMILNLFKRESGRRLVARTAGQILSGKLPTPLFVEVKRMALRLRTSQDPSHVGQIGNGSTNDEKDGPVSAFVSRLPMPQQQAIRALAEEQPTEEILASLGIQQRTLRHWRQQVRERAIAVGLLPRCYRTKPTG